VGDKLVLGLDRLCHAIADPACFLIHLAFILAMWFAVRQQHDGRLVRAAATLLLMKVLAFLMAASGNAIFDQVASRQFLSPDNWAKWRIYQTFLVSLLSLSALAYLGAVFARDTSEAAAVVAPLLVGAMTLVMLGFSPTVYASGQRIALVFEMCLILFICQFVGRIWQPGREAVCDRGEVDGRASSRSFSTGGQQQDLSGG
jgi:hypothetical protein